MSGIRSSSSRKGEKMTRQEKQIAKYLEEFIPKEMLDFEELDVHLTDCKREQYLEAEYKQVLLHLIDWLKSMHYSKKDIAECILYFASGKA